MKFSTDDDQISREGGPVDGEGDAVPGEVVVALQHAAGHPVAAPQRRTHQGGQARQIAHHRHSVREHEKFDDAFWGSDSLAITVNLLYPISEVREAWHRTASLPTAFATWSKCEQIQIWPLLNTDKIIGMKVWPAASISKEITLRCQYAICPDIIWSKIWIGPNVCQTYRLS